MNQLTKLLISHPSFPMRLGTQPLPPPPPPPSPLPPIPPTLNKPPILSPPSLSPPPVKLLIPLSSRPNRNEQTTYNRHDSRPSRHCQYCLRSYNPKRQLGLPSP